MVIQNFVREGPLPLQKVATQLKATLFGPIEKQVMSEALRAKVIRVALWEQSVLCQPHTISYASTTTLQLLNRARMLWTPLHATMQQVTSSQSADSEDREQQPEEEELNRQTLDTLAEQGDSACSTTRALASYTSPSCSHHLSPLLTSRNYSE